MGKITQILKRADEKYGEGAGIAWLRYHYSLPENAHEFPYLFPSHATLKTPPFHREILHDIEGGGRIARAAPRGFAKSTVIDVIAASKFAIYGRYHFMLIISDTYTQAKLQLGALKSELERNHLLQAIYGKLEGKTWGEDRIIVNGLGGEVMIMALGVGMKIRGLRFKQYRPELVIADDLENQEQVGSTERRHKLERWFTYDLLPAMSKDNNNIIFIGTILHNNSLLQKAINKEGAFSSWDTKLYKALQQDGSSLWPERATPEKLMAMRDDPKDPDYMGTLVFSQEMQNEPQDDRDRIFTTDWLSQRYKLAEEEHRHKTAHPESDEPWHKVFFNKIVIGVDPAISEKETADFFAMVAAGFAKENGHIYTLDYFKERIGDPLKQVEAILNMAQQWTPDAVRIEIVAYQQGLYNLVRSEAAKRNYYPPLTPFKPDKDKVRRARIHSAPFSGKLVHIREDHPLAQSFINELLQFPLGEHDDMLDAYMNAAEDAVSKTRPRIFTQKAGAFR